MVTSKELFRLADLQLKREGRLKDKFYIALLFDRAERILKYLENQDRGILTANRRFKNKFALVR